jgi:hypothetical protein
MPNPLVAPALRGGRGLKLVGFCGVGSHLLMLRPLFGAGED